MADIEEDDPINDKPMPLLEHLVELRRRLMWSIGAFLICFMVSYYFSSRIYFFLAEPLADVLRSQGNPDPHLIYTQLYEAFFTRIKVAFFAGAFIAFPIIANQIWLFVAPGLYRSEKRALLPFLLATPVLFFLGAALAYYFVFPFAWKFFASFQDPTGGGGVPIELLPRCQRISRPGDEADLRVRPDVRAAGAADAAGQGGDHLVEGTEAVPPLCLCRDVRDRRDPGTARCHHADRPRSAADRALRNLHHCGEDGGAETSRSVTGHDGEQRWTHA